MNGERLSTKRLIGKLDDMLPLLQPMTYCRVADTSAGGAQ